MMNISASQFIAFFTVAVPTLAGLFSFWLASIKDGFDQEKAFDLVAYGLTGGVAVNLAVAMGKARALIFDVTAINPFAFLFGFMAVISYVVLKRKWSLYRVADNLAISLTLAAGFWLLMRGFLTGFRPVYLLLAVLLFIAYYFLQKYRPLVIKSGFTIV
ncbi:hypothetical protein KKG63_03145 [Patescibacteria group bacterium]|nr:hypothetical protein [Patescibacteria group bacterium]